MKKIGLILLTIFISLNISAQKYNETAEYLMETFPDEFCENIYEPAVEETGKDKGKKLRNEINVQCLGMEAFKVFLTDLLLEEEIDEDLLRYVMIRLSVDGTCKYWWANGEPWYTPEQVVERNEGVRDLDIEGHQDVMLMENLMGFSAILDMTDEFDESFIKEHLYKSLINIECDWLVLFEDVTQFN